MILGATNGIVGRYIPLRAQRWCARHCNRFGIVPVIVYQMAKVGSSAVVAGLQGARLPTFHVHRMDAEHLHQMREDRRALGWFVPPVARHDRLGLRLRRELLDRGGRTAMVTLVRDPIARNISSYFEHVDAIWHRMNAHQSISVDLLVEGFRTRFPHQEPLNWFDEELFRATGIDVFQREFPASGHLTISNQNVELLVMKSELPDTIKASLLSNFVGRAISLSVINSTSAKPKGKVFHEFMSELRLDPRYVEEMLESRYARHFYTEAERAELWNKYTQR